MTKKEAAIVGAYTGVLMGGCSDLHKYIEAKMGRPVFTHEMASEQFMDDLKKMCKSDFLDVCSNLD